MLTVHTPTALALVPHAAQPLALQGGQEEVDPLAALDDVFDGTDSLTDRGWSIYGGSTITTQTIGDGELVLESTTGGGSGAWWYSQSGFRQDGSLVYKLVTGDLDVRVRVRVRGAGGTGSPTGGVASEWRFAGLAIHDPVGLDSGFWNYTHVALGGSPNGANRIEWKVTDDDGAGDVLSTFDDVAGSADLDYDLRSVKVGQVVTHYYRRTDSGEPLDSDDGWTELVVVDKSTNTPARSGGTTPQPFSSDEVAVGIMPPYAGPQIGLDQHMTVEAIRFRTVG